MMFQPFNQSPTARQLEAERQAVLDQHAERLRYAQRSIAFGHEEIGRRLLREACDAIHQEVRGALCRLTGDVRWLMRG